MLTFKEIWEKTKLGRKNIENSMELSKQYHPDDADLCEGLSRADRLEVCDSLNQMSLAEVMAKSGTAGLQGAAYLVVPKLYDEIILHSQKTDIVPYISAAVVNEYKGNDLLNVQVVGHRSYMPTYFSSAGKIAEQAIKTVQAQLTPKSFGLIVPMGNDLLEDNQYGLIQYHIDKAAEGFGDFASELALNVLKTATDGDGTVNGGASGDADETKWTGASTTGIDTLYAALSDDRWIPDTLIMTTEAWDHSVQTTYLTLANGMVLPYRLPEPTAGFHCKIGIPPLNLLFSNNRALHVWTTDTDTGGMTNCVTIMFDRANALLTARKRWMAIEQYVDPIHDLSSACLSARQGSVTLYNDAIGVITET